MGSVNFIAQIVGLLIGIVAVGVPMNTAIYRPMIEEFTESPALGYIGGILALFFSASLAGLRGCDTNHHWHR